jgi:hypothetical protein
MAARRAGGVLSQCASGSGGWVAHATKDNRRAAAAPDSTAVNGYVPLSRSAAIRPAGAGSPNPVISA